MDAGRDPWVAANLSWSISGLGQFYAGRKRAGVLFLLLELSLWSVYLAWLVLPSLPTMALHGASAGLLLLWGLSAWGAHRSLRRPPEPPEAPKNPWKAVLMSRIIPGLGHFYAGSVLRGIMLIGVFVALLAWSMKEESSVAVLGVFCAGRALMFLDPFVILRRENAATRRATLGTLLLVLFLSQVWIPAGILRWAVAETFKIPASSMEPTVMGPVGGGHSTANCPFASAHQPPQGDRILVSKLPYRIGEIQRFDVAVFRFPLQTSKFFVKRVVGLPGEELLMHAGDLYSRRPGQPTFQILRKPLEIQDGLWFPRSDGGSPPGLITIGNSSAFSLKSPVPWEADPPLRGIEEPISDVSWIGIQHRDVKQTLAFHVGNDRAEVALRARPASGDFEVLMSTAGPGQLALRRPGFQAAPVVLDPLEPNRDHVIESMIFDGQWVFRRDGKVVAQIPFLTDLDPKEPAPVTLGGLALGVRGQGVDVRTYSVGYDLYYRGLKGREFAWQDDEPVRIPQDGYVLVGDNVASSHDSRGWLKKTFVLKDGRTVTCEEQQVIRSYSGDFLHHLQEKFKLPRSPDLGIEGDSTGEEVALFDDEIRSQTQEPFRFVDRRFFVGKAIKVWWPSEREHPLR